MTNQPNRVAPSLRFNSNEEAVADGVQRIADALEVVGLPVLVRALEEGPPRTFQEQVIHEGCDTLEEAMPPYMRAHFKGDHWDCPPAECVRGATWRAQMRQTRDTHDETPVPSISTLVDKWANREYGVDGEGWEPDMADSLVQSFIAREGIIARHLLGAAAVRGQELRDSTFAVMKDAGMEVPS